MFLLTDIKIVCRALTLPPFVVVVGLNEPKQTRRKIASDVLETWRHLWYFKGDQLCIWIQEVEIYYMKCLNVIEAKQN